MNFDEFRSWAHRAADWSADYLSALRSKPVRAQVRPGDIAGRLPDAPPEHGQPMSAIFQDFEDIILPGITHWQHPRFFAYFPANSSPPSVIAEYLTATLAAQCMLWQTSPSATELETKVLDWLRQMLGLPDDFHGVIQDSASSATLCAVLTARERALNWRGNEQGLSKLPQVRVYGSAHVHSSIDKAIWIAGIGQENLVKIPVNEKLEMNTDLLEKAIADDLAAGFIPALIVACIGGTSVGASDRIDDICKIAKRHNIYVHVDAAWAGSAMICPEYRAMMAGVEGVDSFVFNPHKWLFTNFDCSAHFVRNPDELTKTLSIQPAYLKTPDHKDITNYSEMSIPLGRRFRALKLWFVIRSYGVEKLRSLIRSHCLWAEDFAKKIDKSEDFELFTPPFLSLLTFRYAPDGVKELDHLNDCLCQAINDDGRIYLTPTRHNDANVIRFQVGQTYTEERDVVYAWDIIREIARQLDSDRLIRPHA